MPSSSHTCANTACRMSLLQPRATDLNDIPPTVDDMIVCGSCGALNVVTLLGTRIMDDNDFSNISPDEARDLRFASRAIQKHIRQS